METPNGKGALLGAVVQYFIMLADKADWDISQKKSIHTIGTDQYERMHGRLAS
ncbi:MAG: hypothetical protein VB076_05890 [Synergistaceae bacterium]|nr:hypothetical protein [Synergistaceae bacterium]